MKRTNRIAPSLLTTPLGLHPVRPLGAWGRQEEEGEEEEMEEEEDVCIGACLFPGVGNRFENVEILKEQPQAKQLYKHGMDRPTHKDRYTDT